MRYDPDQRQRTREKVVHETAAAIRTDGGERHAKGVGLRQCGAQVRVSGGRLAHDLQHAQARATGDRQDVARLCLTGSAAACRWLVETQLSGSEAEFAEQ